MNDEWFRSYDVRHVLDGPYVRGPDVHDGIAVGLGLIAEGLVLTRGEDELWSDRETSVGIQRSVSPMVAVRTVNLLRSREG